MKVVNRVRNNDKETIGYDINDNGVVKFIPAETASSMYTYGVFDNVEQYGKILRGRNCRIPVRVVNDAINVPIIGVHREPEESDVYGKETVDICLRLRKAIRAGRLKVDMAVHKANGGRNVQYFNFIRACGYDVQEFILKFLYDLQPCMVRLIDKKNMGDGINAMQVILATGYNLNMYIKFYLHILKLPNAKRQYITILKWVFLKMKELMFFL